MTRVRFNTDYVLMNLAALFSLVGLNALRPGFAPASVRIANFQK
jgi:hypothetical protein